MTELTEMHIEVLRDPEANAPRQAYADAVQTTDPDRAELIRMQIAIHEARRQSTAGDSSALLFSKTRTLLDRHGARWLKEVTALGYVSRPVMMRGFVEWVTMSAPAFLAHGQDVYGRAPILHVDLTDVKANARELFASLLLDRIHSLGLRKNQLGDDEIELLARSPHLRRLRYLELGNNSIGPAGVEALAASDHLPALRCVELCDNPVPDPTPQQTEGDWGTALRIETPRAGREFEQRYGKRARLDADALFSVYPPDRSAF